MEDTHATRERVRRRVAAQVRRFRAAENLTQEEVANVAGLAVRHFQKIEAAEVNVTIHTLVKIALVLRIDISELFQVIEDKGD